MADLISFKEHGFAHLKNFLDPNVISRVRTDAKMVFLKQMLNTGFVCSMAISEAEFEASLFEYFLKDRNGFINCAKTCQHLINLHRLALDDLLITQQIGRAHV